MLKENPAILLGTQLAEFVAKLVTPSQGPAFACAKTMERGVEIIRLVKVSSNKSNKVFSCPEFVL